MLSGISEVVACLHHMQGVRSRNPSRSTNAFEVDIDVFKRPAEKLQKFWGKCLGKQAITCMYALSLSLPLPPSKHPMCNTCCAFFIGWVAKKDKMEPPADHCSVECFACSKVRSIPRCCSWTCNRQHPSAFEAWVLLQPSIKTYQDHHMKIQEDIHTHEQYISRNHVSATRSDVAPKVFRRSNSDMLDVCLCLQGQSTYVHACTRHQGKSSNLRMPSTQPKFVEKLPNFPCIEMLECMLQLRIDR